MEQLTRFSYSEQQREWGHAEPYRPATACMPLQSMLGCILYCSQFLEQIFWVDKLRTTVRHANKSLPLNMSWQDVLEQGTYAPTTHCASMSPA
jgi:hypothetical protein